MNKKLILKWQILQYLLNVGMVQRSKLYQPFMENDYRHYARVLKSLIDDNYVEVKREKEKNYLIITRLGRKRLEEEKEEFKNIIDEPIINKTNARITKTRRKLYADAAGLCMANKYHVTGHPRFDLLYGNGSAEEVKDAKEVFAKQLKEGIYYEISEIRNAYQKVFGKSEIASQTRMVGVLFIETRMMYVYCIGDSLIAWKTNGEERATQFYIDFFLKSDVIARLIRIERIPRAIIIGDTLKMVPALLHGRKNGIKRLSSKVDSAQANGAQGRISADNLSKIFSAAYYIPTRKIGINMLRIVCTITDEICEELFSKWIKKRGYMRLSSKQYCQGINRNTGDRVIFSPYIDLIELRYYKRQNEVAHFVISNGTQEAVSRAMGPLLESAENMRGVALKFKPCDENGVVLDGNWLYAGGM